MKAKSKTAATMEGLGLKKCDACGDWCNDVVPCNGPEGVTVGDLCGWCQIAMSARPKGQGRKENE